MKTSIKLIVVILLVNLYSLPVSSHSDWGMSYEYGKVNMIAFYGYWQHEEQRKARIIGQMVNMLLEKQNYEDRVNIVFRHSYVKDTVAYKLSYQPMGERWDTENKTGDKEILLEVLSQKYNTRQILQLMEYAIFHTKSIEEKQVEKRVERGFRAYNEETERSEKVYRTVLTVEDDILEMVLNQPESEIVREIMATRFYRPPMEEQEPLFTYYIENNKYYLIYRGAIDQRRAVPSMKYGTQTTDSLLLTLDHIYQMEVTSERRAFVFDTDSSFYMIDMENTNFISARHEIERRTDFYPFQIVEMGRMFGIFTRQGESRTQLWPTRNMIYRIEDDCLFQDMNVLLDSISGNDTRYHNIRWN